MIFGGRFAQEMIRGQRVVYFQPQAKRPRVKVGEHYPIQPRNPVDPKGRPRPSIGRFLVKSVQPVQVKEISNLDAQAADYSNILDLERALARRADTPKIDPDAWYWRIEWEIIQREDVRAAA
jgi:hypothetical protein